VTRINPNHVPKRVNLYKHIFFKVRTWVRGTVELNRRKVGETVNRKDKNTKSEAYPKNAGNHSATANCKPINVLRDPSRPTVTHKETKTAKSGIFMYF